MKTKVYTKEDMERAFEIGQRQRLAQVSNNHTEGYDRDENIAFDQWIDNMNACIYCEKCWDWCGEFTCNVGKTTRVIDYPHDERPATCPLIKPKEL